MHNDFRLLPLACAALALVSGVPAHAQDDEQSEFASLASACLDAQQDGQLGEDEFLSQGFEAQQAPAQFEGRLLIFTKAGSYIPITIDLDDNTCAIRWDAESLGAAQALVDGFVGAIVEHASADEPEPIRHSLLSREGALSRYAFAKGSAAAMMITTIGDELVTFQFVAIHPPSRSN